MKYLLTCIIGAYLLGILWAHAEANHRNSLDTWPVIGTPAYSASCTITRSWEDGSAVAYCTEDGASYVFDPDGQIYQNSAGVPLYPAGWYPCEDTTCTRVNYHGLED